MDIVWNVYWIGVESVAKVLALIILAWLVVVIYDTIIDKWKGVDAIDDQLNPWTGVIACSVMLGLCFGWPLAAALLIWLFIVVIWISVSDLKDSIKFWFALRRQRDVT